MGLFSMFKKDWSAELDRVSQLIESRELVRALELARKAERGAEGPLRERAGEAVQRARAALLDDLLERAGAAESNGELEDAADWLLSAIGHVDDEGQVAEVEARRVALLERAEEKHNPFAAGPGPVADPSGSDPESEIGVTYETLVAMLDESIAPRYKDRPDSFRAALVALNDARATEACDRLDGLLLDSPNDPVLYLERGRARLLTGAMEGAREDFEAAWPELGDGPLDATDSLSVPALWAEATLAAGDSDTVVSLLTDLAAPASQRREICHLYATALLTLERLDEARAYLESASSWFTSDPRFGLLWAQVVAAGGELDQAIAGLETTVGPSCSSGSCARPGRHLPSLRALAELYLLQGENLDRAGELMAIVAHDQQGLLGAEDHGILARYYELVGHDEAAEHADAEARRLTEAGDHETSPAPPQLAVGAQRVL